MLAYSLGVYHISCCCSPIYHKSLNLYTLKSTTFHLEKASAMKLCKTVDG